jgi:hypothetical protein
LMEQNGDQVSAAREREIADHHRRQAPG